jgi:hypothetical protein
MCPAVLPKNFISIDANRFVSFFLRVQISLPYKRKGTACPEAKSGNRTTGLPKDMLVTRLNVKAKGRPNDGELFVMYVCKTWSFILRETY